MPIAHFNVARLRADPGQPLVAPFIDAVPRVNALAERSPGFIWRLDDGSTQVPDAPTYQAVGRDIRLAISLSVWADIAAVQFFVQQTVHGAFLRKRVEWFEAWEGPNYVIWPCAVDFRPTLDDSWAKLRLLASVGPTDLAHGFDWPINGPN
jgi:hypothetical protein